MRNPGCVCSPSRAGRAPLSHERGLLTRLEIRGFPRMIRIVKKFIAFIFALVSGLYLLVWGPMVGPLDPVPIVDEATALLIFVKSMAVLGVDLSRFLPFLGKKTKTPPKPPGQVVDV